MKNNCGGTKVKDPFTQRQKLNAVNWIYFIQGESHNVIYIYIYSYQLQKYVQTFLYVIVLAKICYSFSKYAY